MALTHKLQRNCNKEGFNVKVFNHNHKLRIGIVGNNEHDCESCDSLIGFGIEANWSSQKRSSDIMKWSSGNVQFNFILR